MHWSPALNQFFWIIFIMIRIRFLTLGVNLEIQREKNNIWALYVCVLCVQHTVDLIKTPRIFEFQIFPMCPLSICGIVYFIWFSVFHVMYFMWQFMGTKSGLLPCSPTSSPLNPTLGHVCPRIDQGLSKDPFFIWVKCAVLIYTSW